MKSRTTTLFAALILLAVSCTKDNTTIQSSSISDESSTQALSTDVSELAVVKAVTIGTQVWMTKNLNVTHYRNGDRIPYIATTAKWAALTTGAWCWYRNDSANGAIYGKLYNWYAVKDPRGLAPEGWHVPSDAEWTTLTTFLGGESIAGGKMKSTGTIEAGTGLWREPNTDATNSSDFTGLPGGGRTYLGPFFNVGYYGYWWSSTENYTYSAWTRNLHSFDGSISRQHDDKHYGWSIRCLKD